MKEDYKLIPMSEISDEARKLAVAWMECEDKDWIGQKHKLASDIMNYAKKHWKDYLPTDAEIDRATANYVKSVGIVRYIKEAAFDFREGVYWIKNRR
jgi:hypothetical protein